MNRRDWLVSAAGAAGLAGCAGLDPAVRASAPRMKISSFKATLVASPEPALLNSWGVHGTHFKRTILEIETSDGARGISETYGGTYEDLVAARDVVLGRDPFELEILRRKIENVRALGAVEVACLDLIGRAVGRRVVDLLGGPFREAAPFSAYLFFVMPTPGGPEVTTPEAIARQFLDFQEKYGFASVKFKGGVLPPDREIEALRRMRAARPQAPLRIDPNAAWSVETSIRVSRALEAVGLQYLEDPTPGLDGMAAVRKETKIPLATNMVVTRLEHVAPGFEKKSIDVVLLDHHYMGGLTGARAFASICEALGWGCSGHSNSHLGISMAAMAHLNCAVSHAAYDADTHYPWTTEDVIRGPMLAFKDGKMAPPPGPGLGVEIDPDKLARLRDNVARARDREALLEKWNPAHPRGQRRVRW